VWWRVPAAAATILLGGIAMRPVSAADDDVPAGPRAAAWKRVQQALDEGKPKTAAEALAGVEEAAAKDKAWAEVTRAIATRVLTATGDRPPDDPERLVQLSAAIEKAPAETRAVLRAIQANWTWGFFQNNRWRFAQRTAGGTATGDLATIASWDLPGIVGEIRKRFAAALVEPAALQKLPVAEWTALITPGSMPDAYRPTVWDVVARDALEFATSGERGVVAPEDVFELSADSPALGTPEEFLAWKPEEDPAVTDRDSPLLEAAQLYRNLLAFHKADADRTAFLAADLDRILWAAGAATGEGIAERKQAAFEAFITRAGEHETAALARFHLAALVREAGDPVEARAIAAQAVAAHPKSPGGVLAKNLIAEIEAVQLAGGNFERANGLGIRGRFPRGFVVPRLGGLQQRHPHLPLDPLPVENPPGRPREQPGQHDHRSPHRPQVQQPGVIGGQVVQVRHQGDVELGVEQQGRRQILLQLPLGGVPARGLRNDDGQFFGGHRFTRSSDP
jgi:hypothetical protein